MDNINILVTGAGAPGILGTLYSLKNNDKNIKFKVITTDINEDSVGKFFSDSFYKVLPPEDPNYNDNILNICEKEKINVILPQTTREIMVLSKSKELFESKGIRVCISDYESINIANDKYLLLEKSKELNLPTPDYILTNNEIQFLDAIKKLGYPENNVVIKPRLSNGMRGVRIITNKNWDVNKFLNDKPDNIEIDLENLIKILRNGIWPELIVCEYLPGEEYTVDIFRNKDQCIVIPRKREKIRSGISFETIIELREDLIEYSKKLANELDLKYAFGFQYKLDKNRVPKLLESNPRVQGTMVASTFAGFNVILYSVLDCLGYKLDIDNIKIMDGTKFKRYWGGIGIINDTFIGKI